MATFCWTKERTGWLWDEKDEREEGDSNYCPLRTPHQWTRGQAPSLFGARLRKDPPLTQR